MGTFITGASLLVAGAIGSGALTVLLSDVMMAGDDVTARAAASVTALGLAGSGDGVSGLITGTSGL